MATQEHKTHEDYTDLSQIKSMSKTLESKDTSFFSYKDDLEIDFKVGDKVPYHPDYLENAQCYNFWQLSFQCGHSYKNGKDCDNEPIFMAHENESKQSQKRRKAYTPSLNFCKPIVSKYNNFIFTSTVERDTTNVSFNEWSKNVDLFGTPLHEFMRRQFECAQKLGRYYILIDSTKTSPYLTEEQAKAEGHQLFLTDFHPDRVINWVRKGDTLTEACIIMPEKSQVYHYTWKYFRVITYKVDKQGRKEIIEVSPQIPHGYDVLPLVELVCDDDTQPQIDEIAELQKSIYNLISLHHEELFKQTFTSYLLIGASLHQIASGNNIDPSKQQFFYKDIGARRFTCIAQDAQGVKVEALKADPAQAQNIQDAVNFYIGQLYKHAGMAQAQAKESGQVESAKALQIKFNDVAITARALADHAQAGENAIIDLWSVGMQTEVEHTNYCDDFTDEDIAQELADMLDILAAEVPSMMKVKAAKSVGSKMFDLDDDEQTELEQAAEALYDVPKEEPLVPT